MTTIAEQSAASPAGESEFVVVRNKLLDTYWMADEGGVVMGINTPHLADAGRFRRRAWDHLNRAVYALIPCAPPAESAVAVPPIFMGVDMGAGPDRTAVAVRSGTKMFWVAPTDAGSVAAMSYGDDGTLFVVTDSGRAWAVAADGTATEIKPTLDRAGLLSWRTRQPDRYATLEPQSAPVVTREVWPIAPKTERVEWMLGGWRR